jgi:hypothetical protein
VADMSKAKPPKPRRNQFDLVTPQHTADERRNHRNHPLKGRGELVSPLARGVALSAIGPRLRLRFAGASLRRAAPPALGVINCRSMSPEQVVRRLRAIRYSPDLPRIRRQRPGLRSIARGAGLSHMTVYRVIRTGYISAAHAEALRRALDDVTRQP